MSVLIGLILLLGFLIMLSVGLVSVIFDLSKMSCHAAPDPLFVPHEKSLDDEERGMNKSARSAPQQIDLRNS
jgi:hypothetical protein